MCGIVGIVGRAAGEEQLLAAAELLSRRGPDDCGAWSGERVGLANRRLSILDVSAAGHQPMISGNNRYVIVFNGEIYNFQEIRKELGTDDFVWHSRSDTEVVLNAYAKWGSRCLERLEGMFAFAIWDCASKSLFVARDRMGVKPLYYAKHNGCFAFASRPRALRVLLPDLGRSIDAQGLRYYLDIGYFPGEFSLTREIRRLPAGHFLVVDEHGATLTRYWNLADTRPDPTWESRTEVDLVDELESIVRRSVKSRLVSDVPVGAFLSGGVDSSLVVAVMKQLSPGPIDTFTIGFNESEYDESERAAAVARALGTRHHAENISVDQLLELMPVFSREYDEPFFDSSAFATMAASRLARRYVRVVLGGDGGDELFGGYHYYRIVSGLSALFKLPASVRRIVSGAIGLLPSHNASLLASAIGQASGARVFPFIRSISKDFPGILLPEVSAATQGIADLFLDVCMRELPNMDLEDAAMRFDALFTLPDDYLQKLDVASMAYSLEAREPLLSTDLVAWAMRLPQKWKLRGMRGKYLLRRLALRYLEPGMLNRRKKGFEVPISRWLSGPLRDWARQRLHDDGSFNRIPIDQARVQMLFEQHCRGMRNASPILWAVLMLIEFVNLHHH